MARSQGDDEETETEPEPSNLPWVRWPLAFWSAILFGIPLIVAIGCFALPDLVWDGFVWKYLWGPIVADGGGDSGGIKPGYNMFNTMANAVWMILFALWSINLGKTLKWKLDDRLYPPVIMFVILGAITRTLEDMVMIQRPLNYLFITPVIYLKLAFLVVGWMFVGHFFEQLMKKDKPIPAFGIVGGAFALMNGIYIGIFIHGGFTYFIPHPVFPMIASVAAMGILFLTTKNTFRFFAPNYQTVATLGGLAMVLVATIAFCAFPFDISWQNQYVGESRHAFDPNYDGGFLIAVAWILCTLIIFAIGYALKNKHSYFKTLSSASVTLVVAAQMLDAAATALTLQLYPNYHEKHVLPAFFIEVTGTPMVMFPLKLIIILPFVFILDKWEKQKQGDIDWGLVTKLGLILLGFAPGARDILRLLMGV